MSRLESLANDPDVKAALMRYSRPAPVVAVDRVHQRPLTKEGCVLPHAKYAVARRIQMLENRATSFRRKCEEFDHQIAALKRDLEKMA